MPRSTLVSRARNGEDVVLLRALGHLASVRYALLATDLGVMAPGAEALEASGWAGQHLTVPDQPGLVAQAVAALEAEAGAPVHVLWVAVPDRAEEVFPSVQHAGARPWVVLVECSAEAGAGLDAGAADARYTAQLFDGVSRYYVAEEHDELIGALSYPPCSRDNFVPYPEAQARERSESLLQEVVHWRRLAVTGWADAVVRPRVDDVVGMATGDARRLEYELAAMRQTLSWRVTRPLRVFRRVLIRIRAHL